MARTAARDAAFLLLFQGVFGVQGDLDGISALKKMTLDDDDRIYVQDITRGCGEHEDELDDAIARHARGWEIDRIAKADLCLLRLAAYEILRREDIPASVTVNEVVELARTYSTDEAPGYINGVLGALVREVGKE